MYYLGSSLMVYSIINRRLDRSIPHRTKVWHRATSIAEFPKFAMNTNQSTPVGCCCLPQTHSSNRRGAAAISRSHFFSYKAPLLA